MITAEQNDKCEWSWDKANDKLKKSYLGALEEIDKRSVPYSLHSIFHGENDPRTQSLRAAWLQAHATADSIRYKIARDVMASVFGKGLDVCVHCLYPHFSGEGKAEREYECIRCRSLP